MTFSPMIMVGNEQFDDSVNSALDRIVAPSSEQITSINNNCSFDRRCIDEVTCWAFDL